VCQSAGRERRRSFLPMVCDTPARTVLDVFESRQRVDRETGSTQNKTFGNKQCYLVRVCRPGMGYGWTTLVLFELRNLSVAVPNREGGAFS
jgi:hypothetical protein